LIAGERRWRAAQLLNLPEVPVITREADDRAVLELALIENLQRENLNAIEEAHGYAQLAETIFNSRRKKSRSRSAKAARLLANSLRLIKFAGDNSEICPRRTDFSRSRESNPRIGRRKKSKARAERVIKEGLNVRQTEGLVAKLQKRAGKSASQPEIVGRASWRSARRGFGVKAARGFCDEGSIELRARQRLAGDFIFQRRGTGEDSANSRCETRLINHQDTKAQSFSWWLCALVVKFKFHDFRNCKIRPSHSPAKKARRLKKSRRK